MYSSEGQLESDSHVGLPSTELRAPRGLHGLRIQHPLLVHPEMPTFDAAFVLSPLPGDVLTFGATRRGFVVLLCGLLVAAFRPPRTSAVRPRGNDGTMDVRWMSRVGATDALPTHGSRPPLHSRAGHGHNKYQTNARSPSKHGVPWVGTEMQAKRTPAAGWSLRRLVAFVLHGCAILSTLESGAHAESPVLDFNRDIRPILAENCFYCHGQDANKRQADLRLDVRDAAIEAGAIVPKDPRPERARLADQRDGSQGADAPSEVEPAAHSRAKEAAGALDRGRGELRHALGLRRSRATGRCPP